jgi:dihydropteroate synthase
MALLRYLSHFKTLKKELLVGASRKSMIDAISPSSASKRLGGTLAIHLKALQEGASIVRVHDVFEHAQAFALWQALEA